MAAGEVRWAGPAEAAMVEVGAKLAAGPGRKQLGRLGEAVVAVRNARSCRIAGARQRTEGHDGVASTSMLARPGEMAPWP